MKLSPKDIARMIDISAVQASHGEAEILELVNYAKEYGFIAVHALPCWTRYLHKLLNDREDILVGGPVGFPSGAHKTEFKILEAKQLIADGAREVDVMMNLGMLRSGRDTYVKDEIKALVEAAENIPVKVILEVYYLTPDEIKRACDYSISAGAAFVKTGTGWAPGGATREIIALITSHVGDAIQVKASGGVRRLDTLIEMYKMGVRRFGINVQASISIIRECRQLPGGLVTI